MNNNLIKDEFEEALKPYTLKEYYDLLENFDKDTIIRNAYTYYKIAMDFNDLQQENKQLKEQLDKYENPDDMTLMMMWATDKVKDENKQLKEIINKITNG